MKVTTAIILDTRKARKNGKYPVKLRVTFKRKQKYYTLNTDPLSKDEFEKVQSPRPRGEFKALAISFNTYENGASEFIKTLNVFTFDQFEQGFINDSYANDVFTFFEKRIKELQEGGQIGTAQTYKDALQSFQVFTKKKTLLFVDITVSYLNKYENYMIQNDKSLTTVGIYLRNLRAIYNLAGSGLNPLHL